MSSGQDVLNPQLLKAEARFSLIGNLVEIKRIYKVNQEPCSRDTHK